MEENYIVNFVAALIRTMGCCKNEKIPCNKFDIWAYAKIYYHIELYNKPLLEALMISKGIV